MPEKEKILDLIKNAQRKLNEIEDIYEKLEGYAYIEDEIGLFLSDYESASVDLIDELETCFRAAEYLCPCNSGYKMDRENDNEEGACIKCFSNSEEF